MDSATENSNETRRCVRRIDCKKMINHSPATTEIKLISHNSFSLWHYINNKTKVVAGRREFQDEGNDRMGRNKGKYGKLQIENKSGEFS